jgi:pSer/pThr/pTyr-binding forkhead associated (FHA) protein
MAETLIHNPSGGTKPPDSSSSGRTKHVGLLGPDSVALYVGNTPDPLIVQIGTQVILGRLSPDATQPPRLDLMPYGAYEKGVSRTHAAIRRTDTGGFSVEDLGSNNGSALNGTRLVPYIASPLKSGDRLKLSQLEIEVYLGGAEAANPQPLPSVAPFSEDILDEAGELVTAQAHPISSEEVSTKEQSETAEKMTDDAPLISMPGVPATAKFTTGESLKPTLIGFHGEVPLNAKYVFSQMGHITEEILRLLAAMPGSEVKLTLQIDARTKMGYDDTTVKGIIDASRTLKFSNFRFEED